MVSKHETFYLIRPLRTSGSPVTQLNKSFIKNYTKDVLTPDQLLYFHLINGDIFITIKLDPNMLKVRNIMLNM